MLLRATTFMRSPFRFAALLAAVLGTVGTASAGTMDYTPSIDIIPTATFAVGNDEVALPGPGNNPFQSGDVKFNFVFTQPLAKHVNFQFEQDRSSGYDVTIGTAIQGGQKIVAGSINDIVNEFRVGYSMKNVGLSLGTNYRWRECCPNAGQVGNLTPTTWHGTYLQLNLTTDPIRQLNGTTFTLTAHQTYNLWRNSPTYQAFEASNGIPVNGNKARFPFWYGLNANVPINSGLTIYGFFGTGAFDYFDNSISPYYYDLADFGLVKTVNKYVTFIASIDSLSQQHLERSNPFLLPNAIHRAYLATALRFHLGK
ncbi:MAG: hypothetical protein NVS2B3_01050 [Vulcanimicrobiaceae bacterium]